MRIILFPGLMKQNCLNRFTFRAGAVLHSWRKKKKKLNLELEMFFVCLLVEPYNRGVLFQRDFQTEPVQYESKKL